MLTTEGYIVIGVIILMIVALYMEVMRTGLILFSATAILLALGIINDKDALAGFANKGMITVAILFIVSEGVRQSGILNLLAQSYLPRKRRKMVFLLPQIMLPVSFISAFLNNTPVVIIFAQSLKNGLKS